MSSLWTPDGERPVNPPQQAPGQMPDQPPHAAPGAADPRRENRTPPGFDSSAAADHEAQMEQMRAQLANAPASTIVANHCFGLFELAALHLSLDPPKLGEAQIAIDALGALIENLSGRLGGHEEQLREGLSQLRLAFVTIRKGTESQN